MPTAQLSPQGVQHLNDLVANAEDVPTFVFGATNLEKEIYFNGKGNIDFHDPTSEPVSPSSIFWICSMTKFISSLAALQLIERGVLSMETPISQFMREFSNPVVLNYPYGVENPTFQHAQNAVKVKHLLNHSSGLYYSLRIPDPPYALEKGYTMEHDEQNPHGRFFETIQGNFPSIPLKFEPGSNWAYGWSCDIIGFLVEKVTGVSFEQYCQENIFKPLGMTASFCLSPALKKDLVNLTFRDPDNQIVSWANQTPLIEQNPKKVFNYLGGIGCYTSLRDYLSLLRHILRINAGLPVDGPIINQQTAESLFQPTLTEKGSKSLDRMIMLWTGLQHSTGLALLTQDVPGMRKKGSGFWGGWAGTTFFLDPTSGVAVVFGVQMVPTDGKVQSLSAKLERGLYSYLEYEERLHKL